MVAAVNLPGYQCRICGREFMLREPVTDDCTGGGRHWLEYAMLARELPYD